MKSFKMHTGNEGAEDKTDAAKKNNSVAGGILALVLFGGFGWYFWGGGLQQQASTNLDQIKQQVASDSVQQYNIAKRDGTKMDACVQAGLVTAAYLQAQDESSYQQWKQIESADCSAAGVPR